MTTPCGHQIQPMNDDKRPREGLGPFAQALLRDPQSVIDALDQIEVEEAERAEQAEYARRRRRAVVEDTRFTREDARLNREEILASIGTPRWIEERLAVLAEQNSDLKQQNRELAQQVQTLLYKLDAIERQLQARPAGVWIDRLGGWRLALTALREVEH